MKITQLAIAALITMTSQAIADDAAKLVEASALKYGVPVEFALQVATHETKLQCDKIGSNGERGPLQVLPSTARHLGFNNVRNSTCAVQTDAGMAHLAMCYKGVGGNRWYAAACHNQGMSAMNGKLKSRAKRYANAVMGI